MRSDPAAEAQARLRAFIRDVAYPCLGAKSAVARGGLDIVMGGPFGCPGRDADLHGALLGFVERYRAAPGPFRSLAIVFDAHETLGEAAFETLLWRRLQGLTDVDAVRGFPHDPRVSADPRDARFAWSLGGEGFFVIGLHPGASRPARRFERPTLVFNPHDQFERLRADGRYEGLRARTTERDRRLAGSANPMLAAFGERSEARQYSGRAVGPDWTCPFSPPPGGTAR